MDDLTPKIRELAARLSGRDPSREGPSPPPSTPVPALRRALRAWFAMTAREADGTLPTIEEARSLLSEIRRLWDDVGPAFAEAVERQEARTFYRETGRCPFCGAPGLFHDSDREGER